jgi:hypothetical protein
MALKAVKVEWGADPEAFFSEGERIVGSEKLVPKRGLGTPHGRITRDGVQFELHPNSATSIRELARNIGGLLQSADTLAREEGMQIEYRTLVEVSNKEFETLSPENQVLGCTPSLNAYGDKPLTIDPTTYRKRSAAGHIHVGISDKQAYKLRHKLVPVADVLVGNTCVLLDRDPGASERRENYGRAGEYRLPKHGLEYRTMSNFWLRDPSLMAFAFGLMSVATSVFHGYVAGDREAWDALEKLVNIRHFTTAIDTNNFGLALKNFNTIAPFLHDYLPSRGFSLTPDTIGTFVNLAQAVNREGLDHFFPLQNMLARWRKPSFNLLEV